MLYGNMGNQKNIVREVVMLPVDNADKPDYAFMEEYIKEREQQLIQKYIAHVRNTSVIIRGGITPLHEKDLAEFDIRTVFPAIRRGKRLKTADHIEGNIPYVSSSAANNAVDAFIGNEGHIRKYKNCITLANSGSVGTAFYHCYEFIASDHVTALQSNRLNKYSYLFVATMVSRLQEKYSFNREINDLRINKEKVLLPVDSDSQPDWQYME